jgi:Zn-finger nucleic acid-binding protein
VLQRFNDRYFPQDIILERCSSCHGIWLNRGLFAKYQKFRQELARPKEKSPEDRKLEESINQLVADYRAEQSSGKLKSLSEFLSPSPLAEEKAAGFALDALGTLMMILRFLVP